MNPAASPTASVAVVVAVGAVIVLTVGIGIFGVRARTTSDLLVASRSVSVRRNAAAVSGEYLSAASFLGIAGLVMRNGLGMAWYPIGYVAGYLVLLLFVTAPLRRFGAYTIPDFAEERLESRRLRQGATAMVLVIGLFYLLPQLEAAGLTLQTLLGAPSWLGVVLVGSVITANIASGGMRGITLVQAFQYWAKLVAIALPALVLLAYAHGAHLDRLDRPGAPTFPRPTAVRLATPATLDLTSPVLVTGVAHLDGRSTTLRVELAAGDHVIGAGAVLHFAAGQPVPGVTAAPVPDAAVWSRPLGSPGDPHPLFATYSLILATFLGTTGLPHVLVRFYTNPDGPSARRTALTVLGLLSVFYIFPIILGALGRLEAPGLYVTGQTDAVVLLLPRSLVGGVLGAGLTAVVAGGAFAAFLSTSSGLLMSVAGAVSHDLLGRSVRTFRWSAVGAGAVATSLGLLTVNVSVTVLVGWAFAIAASSFCPLLILGIWWRRLTPRGAGAGLVVGGGTASLAVLATILGYHPGGWPGELLSEPAAWTVPLAFAVMTTVSLLTPSTVPASVDAVMTAMHLPEALRVRTREHDE